MSERGLDPYRCTSCPNRLTYLDPVPRRETRCQSAVWPDLLYCREKATCVQKEEMQSLSTRLVPEEEMALRVSDLYL